VIGRAPRRLEGQALKSSGYRQLHIRRDARPQGVIAYATIENAGKLNAINSALMGELVEGMGELAADDRLRAVVLTGAGPKAFIAGVDINEMARIESGAQATAFITRLHQCCAAIRDMPVPVIARIQGYAFGGGLESRRRAMCGSLPTRPCSACPKSSSAFPRSSKRRCCRRWSAGDAPAR
jgi:1,4-dihydroxy-2-naphthoyl-CoA synthase